MKAKKEFTIHEALNNKAEFIKAMINEFENKSVLPDGDIYQNNNTPITCLCHMVLFLIPNIRDKDYPDYMSSENLDRFMLKMNLTRDKVYELTPELISNSSSPYFFKSSNGLDYEIKNRLIFLKKYYEEIISNKK